MKTAAGIAARMSRPAPQAMATANPWTTAAVGPAVAWAARQPAAAAAAMVFSSAAPCELR